MDLFEFEGLKQESGITAIDIDREGLRVAVVSGGAVLFYSAVQLAYAVTERIGKYKSGYLVQCIKWSYRPYSLTSDLLGDYLLAIGKEDGSLSLLGTEDAYSDSAEVWKAKAKVKDHTSGINSVLWRDSNVFTSGTDLILMVYAVRKDAKGFLVNVTQKIDTGMNYISGICVSGPTLFAQVIAIQNHDQQIMGWNMLDSYKKVICVDFCNESTGKKEVEVIQPCATAKWACFLDLPSAYRPEVKCLMFLDPETYDCVELPLDIAQEEETEVYGKRSREDTLEIMAQSAVETARGIIVGTNIGIILISPTRCEECRLLHYFESDREITVSPM